MATIDPSLLNSIFSVTYRYAPDPGDTVSYTRALINIKNINSLTVDTLTYSNIDFGDASGNLFVGDRAGCNSSLVSNCTGIGEQSMDYLAGGSNVEGLGFSSLRNTASLTRVIAIGTFAGDSNSNVADTVIVGSLAARNLSGASSNVIIGSGAGASLTGGSNNIFIGAGVNPVSGVGNNVFNIGNTLYGTTGGPLTTASGVTVNGVLTVCDTSATVRVCDTLNRQPTLELNRNAGAPFGSSGIADWKVQVTQLGGNYQLVRGNSTNTITPFQIDGGSGNIGINTAATVALQVSGSTTVGSATASSTNIAWTTNTLSAGGQQTYKMYILDSDTTQFGFAGAGYSNQMIAFAYPSLLTPSSRGTEVESWRVLLRDQAISGLSAGDVYVHWTLAAVKILTDNLSAAGTVSANNLAVGGMLSAQNASIIGTLSVASAVVTQTTILSALMGPFQQTANGNPYGTATFVFWDPSNLSYSGSTIDNAYVTPDPASTFSNFPSTFVLSKSGLYSITLTRTDLFNPLVPRAITLDSRTAIQRGITSGGATGTADTVTTWLPAGSGLRITNDGGTLTQPFQGESNCGIVVRLLHQTT